MARTGACWPDLLACPQVTSEAARTFIVAGLEVLKRLERRAEAYSGGSIARAAALVREAKMACVRGSRGG